jgi:DNA (cytosine-5)-methyltransferase 1
MKRLLDLYCGAGGTAVGYHRAGFEVVGVDIDPQPNYPFEFVQMDAFEYLDLRVRWDVAFDAVHASPPCQHYANVTRWRGDPNTHPALIAPIRAALRATGLPYVIENVRTTALHDPFVLCGSTFGLAVRRHRYFESNVAVPFLTLACDHDGRLPFMHKNERAYADAMGCDWMTAREARQAIPPAYTEFIGRQLINQS